MGLSARLEIAAVLDQLTHEGTTTVLVIER
jgi:hypothetical protein